MARALLVFLLLATALWAGDWKAPDGASHKVNPLANRPELAAGGEKIYRRICHTCHAESAAGEQKKGPGFASPEVQSESDGALFWKISNGNSRTGMPSFGSLPEPQRWQLVLFIRSLAKPK